jgi:ATP-dependent Clp protease ATP-binding subunit ClpA
MGHSSIKTEHLLLGLLDEEDGGARRLLDVMGANGDRLRVATLAALAKS